MKKIILTIIGAIILVQTSAFAKNKFQVSKKDQKIICKRIYVQSKINCEQYACEAYMADSGRSECSGVETEDGDYNEGINECIFNDEFASMLKNYNQSYIDANLTCDNVDL